MFARKITALMSFSLPAGWQGEECDYQWENRDPDRSAEDFADITTAEEQRALKAYFEVQHRRKLQESVDWPMQYNAWPSWLTDDTSAGIDIFSRVHTYCDRTMKLTNALLDGKRGPKPEEIIDPDGVYRLFELWYISHERQKMRSDEFFKTARGTEALKALEPQRQVKFKDPAGQAALDEALRKIEVAGLADELSGEPQEWMDNVITNTSIVTLDNKSAVKIEVEQFHKNEGNIAVNNHLILAQQRQLLYHICESCRLKFGWEVPACTHRDLWPETLKIEPPPVPYHWDVLEVHILCGASPNCWEYVRPELMAFVDSIRWLV